jgi:pyruvate formate lyase activating enzyme
VLDYIDLVLFDLKFANREQHRMYTGRDNDLILANFALLAGRGIPMHIRMVMIPGVNDSSAQIRARMELLKDVVAVKQVDMLPYHRYGVGKYARLGLDYPLADLPEHTPEQIAGILSIIEEYGVTATIGG